MSQIKICKIIVILLTLNQLNTRKDGGVQSKGILINNKVIIRRVLEDKIQIDEPQETELTTEITDKKYSKENTDENYTPEITDENYNKENTNENESKENTDENVTPEITDENYNKENTNENKEQVVDGEVEDVEKIKDESKEEFYVKIIMKYVFTIIFFCF